MEQVNKFLGYRTKLLLFPSGTRVAIYNRVSTEKLAQLEAIEHQVIESRQIVEESGLELAFQYIETESGTSIKNREYYQQMLTDMANDKFDILMIKSQDRMMRDQAEWHLLKRAINKYHKILYFYMDDEIFNQKENGMKHDVQAMLDEYESEKKSSKAIHSHNRRQTTYEGQDCLNITRPIYGWDRNVELDSRGHKKIWFTVNEKEAENIREVCRLVEEGKGFYTIANIMYGNGVLSKPTYGTKPQLPHKISGTAWKKVIRSPLLHGDAVFNKEKTDFYTKDRQKVPQDQWIYRENVITPILSKEYHQRIIDILDSRSIYYDKDISMKGKHFWSGKIICSKCGKAYYRYPCKSCKTRVLENWKCSTGIMSGTEGCHNIIIEENELRKQLRDTVSEKYQDLYGTITDGLIEKIIRKIEQGLSGSSLERDREEVEKELNQQYQFKNNLFDKLLKNVISDADFQIYNKKLTETINSLEDKKAELEKQVDIYKNKEERLIEIRESMKKKAYGKDAISDLIIGCIEKILVYPSGKLEVMVNKKAMAGKFPIVQYLYSDEQYQFRLVYYRKNIVKQRREENTLRILEEISKNGHRTIPEFAEIIGQKYTYTWSIIKDLRQSGKIEYVKKGFSHEDCYWQIKS